MSTTIDRISQRLAVSLREKFGPGVAGKRALLKKLGFDEARIDEMLRPQLGMDERGNKLPLARDQEGSSGSAPTENAAARMRLELENALADYEGLPEGLVATILKLLERHAPLNRDEEPQPIVRNGEVDPDRLRQAIQRARADGDTGLAARLQKMLHEDGGGEDQEGAELNRSEMPPALDNELVDKYLRGGVDGSVLAKAVDAFPKAALVTGLPGARFAERREHGAMDARLERKGFSVARIDVFGAADHAVDRRPVLSRTGMDKLAKKFPGVENVIV